MLRAYAMRYSRTMVDTGHILFRSDKQGFDCDGYWILYELVDCEGYLLQFELWIMAGGRALLF